MKKKKLTRCLKLESNGKGYPAIAVNMSDAAMLTISLSMGLKDLQFFRKMTMVRMFPDKVRNTAKV